MRCTDGPYVLSCIYFVARLFKNVFLGKAYSVRKYFIQLTSEVNNVWKEITIYAIHIFKELFGQQSEFLY